MNRYLSFFVLTLVIMLGASSAHGYPVPATAQNQEKLAIVGDFGDIGYPPLAVSQMIASWDVEAVISAGDNIHPNGQEEDYQEKVYSKYGSYIDRERFFPALGNHDWGGYGIASWPADGIPLLKHLPYLPGNGRYYTVEFGDNLVAFHILDSDFREPDGRTAQSLQGRWLHNALAGSGALYDIVIMHEPPFSSCLFGSQTDLQWPFREWGATAVVSGHCHNYERLVVDSVPYFITGLGGSREKSGFETILPESRVRHEGGFGAILVSATKSAITFEFRTVTNRVIDRVQIPAR